MSAMNDLMTLQDISELFRCSVRHARDVVVKLPGFPNEVVVPNGRLHWDHQQVWNFANRKPLDAPGAHCLYRHFDADGELLYIGVSLSAVERLSAHNRTARWADKITRVEIERFPTRQAVLAAEEYAIKAERPIYNHQHNRTVRA
jgi:hypothetical protein